MNKKIIREHIEVMLKAMLNGIEFDADVTFVLDAGDYTDEDTEKFHEILQEYDFVVTKNNRRIRL